MYTQENNNKRHRKRGQKWTVLAEESWEFDFSISFLRQVSDSWAPQVTSVCNKSKPWLQSSTPRPVWMSLMGVLINEIGLTGFQIMVQSWALAGHVLSHNKITCPKLKIGPFSPEFQKVCKHLACSHRLCKQGCCDEASAGWVSWINYDNWDWNFCHYALCIRKVWGHTISSHNDGNRSSLRCHH